MVSVKINYLTSLSLQCFIEVSEKLQHKLTEFLLPYSCRATERNGNSISADGSTDIIEHDYNDACFSYFQTMWQLFWTLDKDGRLGMCPPSPLRSDCEWYKNVIHGNKLHNFS
jgi:hypothetical protein